MSEDNLDSQLASQIKQNAGLTTGSGPSNVEQIERAKEIINAVGRPIVTGAEAIRYLDIPYAATWPGP